jgi:ubiquinone/menaquinone biosynthesis C-methylase UbiE
MVENVKTRHQVNVPAGIPTTQLCEQLSRTHLFRHIESFSNHFLATNHDLLLEYSASKPRDPMRNWSRKWEYPFVFTRIAQFVRQKQSKTSILDVGSGVTFFPYCLVSSFDNVRLACSDNTARWGSLFAGINARTPLSVNFVPGDIHGLPFRDESVDVLYCISVLEHINNNESVIQEFYRMLAHDGLLVLTFDLSLDSAGELSLRQAKKTINVIQEYFPEADPNLEHLLALFHDEKRLLNDDSVLRFDRSLNFYHRLWRSVGKTLRIIDPDFDKLTVCCLALRKEQR